MKVLLVLSPMPVHKSHYLASTDSEFPIGLCYLGAVLEKVGHRPEIFDAQLIEKSEKHLSNLIIQKKFDVVGFSAVTPSAKRTSIMASIVKEIRPKTTTIVGGVHPTVTGPDVLKQMPDVDIAVFGEGELTIIDLLEHLEHKKSLDEVRGIAFRTDEQIVRTERRELIKDLDTIPFPAHHLVDLDKYTPPPGLFFEKPIIPMTSSRGCPYDCAFCADTVIWQGRCRMRSAQNVVDEMEYLRERYGAREIKFFDDTFTASRKRTVEICNEILRRNLGLIWRCASRVDKVDPELLKLMRESGCRSISFGIESGDDEILKRMNKKITVEQARQAVKWSKEVEIETKGFFMLNYPGENIETTEKTIRLSRELDLDFVGFNITMPYLGTRLRDEVEKNYRIDEKLWHDTDAALGNQIYFFQDDLPVDYLKKAYRRAARGFYLKPKVILRKLLNIRNLRMLKSYIVGMFRLFRIKAKE